MYKESKNTHFLENSRNLAKKPDKTAKPDKKAYFYILRTTSGQERLMPSSDHRLW